MTMAITQQVQQPSTTLQQQQQQQQHHPQQQQHLLHSLSTLDCGDSCINLHKEPADSKLHSNSSQQLLLVPSFGKLSSFLATTCFLWLSEPLLALVDTTFVSWTHLDHSDQPNLVLQLAAMGLATTFMDTLVYMTYFLAIATTTQIAEQMAHKHVRQLQLSTSRLLGFAILCGSIVTCMTWLLGNHWLQQLARRSGEEAPELVPLATHYVKIRALVAPLTVTGMVAHSFCLVTDHTRTVAVAVLTASVTNIVLDWFLCPRYGMLGAATATSIATSFSACILLRQVFWQMKVWRNREIKQENYKSAMTGDNDYYQYDYDEDLVLEGRLLSDFDNNNTNNSNGSSSNTTTLTGSKQPVPLISLPDRESLVQLLKLSLPLAFYMWAETASYASLTICATEFGPVAMAAQNVLMQVFHFLCCISESLAQAAQAFLPATLYPRYHEQSFWQVLMRLCRVAAVVAVLGYQLSLMLLGGGGSAGSNSSSGTVDEAGVAVVAVARNRLSTFVQDSLDPQVVEQLQLACPYLAICLCFHPFNAVIEGTVIATRDFANIVRTYTITLLLFGLVLKYATQSLGGVWRALVVWQLLRMTNYCFWRRSSVCSSALCAASSSSRSSLSSSVSGSIELMVGGTTTITSSNNSKDKADSIGSLPA